jgi:hypothetical protein
MYRKARRPARTLPWGVALLDRRGAQRSVNIGYRRFGKLNIDDMRDVVDVDVAYLIGTASRPCKGERSGNPRIVTLFHRIGSRSRTARGS